MPSPNRSGRDGHPVRMVVIHGDAGRTDAGTISWIESPDSGISYHYLVGRGGQVHQFVEENEKAWHAGVSEWPDCTVGNSVNPTSIGVAFANDGTGDEPYTSAQYAQGAKLVGGIIRRHRIPIDAVRGHHEVSPGRKTDPWAHFDWQRFIQDVALQSHGRTA
jgi:N-acetylmuramoyl-L-alanine amidase